jgi:AcrR family transcriptional regulator
MRIKNRILRPSQETNPVAEVWEGDLEDSMDQQNEARAVRRRARGLQRIASILDAAETVFAQVGYDEATTHQIAEEAGISPGSLYQFFSNKEEIAQALAARYVEELQRVYSTVFSLEAAALPFSQWLDQIVDAVIAFHLAHPAFHTLFDAPPSLEVAGLTQQLPKELQTQLELGFQVRAPHLSATQRRLNATMAVQLFRSVPRLILQSEEVKQRLLVRELKTILQRYLEPDLG